MPESNPLVNVVNDPPPGVTALLPVDRIQFKLAIARENDALEALRKQEEVLRVRFVAALEAVRYAASNACFRVQTRQWNESNLSGAYSLMREAESALVSCLIAITHQSLIVADMQRDYDDAALWRVA